MKKGKTNRRPRYALTAMQADCRNPLCIRFCAIQTVQILLDLGVVDAQELVRGSGHVHKIGLAFGTLAVKELVNRLILW